MDFDPDTTQKQPAIDQAPLIEATKPLKPVREFAPTVFPRCPVLNAKELETLTAQERAAYMRAKKHDDDWGHLPPQVHKHLVGMEPKDMSPNAVEIHARTKATDPMHFAAAKAFHRWPMGQELSPDDYDAAIELVLSQGHGY